MKGAVSNEEAGLWGSGNGVRERRRALAAHNCGGIVKEIVILELDLRDADDSAP